MINFDIIVEIPKGSRNKYEYDKINKCIRLDRIIYSSIKYPVDYGYIPNTISKDGDPLDVLLCLTEATIPGCLVNVKPISIFYMSDDKKDDEKILCVPISDPNYNYWNDLCDIPNHTKIEIEQFFKTYKNLENKEVIIKGWGDNIEAISMYNKCKNQYKKNLNNK